MNEKQVYITLRDLFSDTTNCLSLDNVLSALNFDNDITSEELIKIINESCFFSYSPKTNYVILKPTKKMTELAKKIFELQVNGNDDKTNYYRIQLTELRDNNKKLIIANLEKWIDENSKKNIKSLSK
ncbi:MAG: hypothetical protein Q4G04_00275 [bacterium]|nr:hypothetical protein [bacterium]